MVLKAKILLRDRNIKEISVKDGFIDFQYNKGLYVIPYEFVREVPEKSFTEAFYFEDNPTPINKNNLDRSANYLGDIIVENYIKQINRIQGGGGPGLIEAIKDLISNPQALVFILLAGIVIYAVYSSGGKLI